MTTKKTSYGLPKKREAVTDALQAAFALGDLDETEYERRLDLAYQADSLEALEKLLHDFPASVRERLFPDSFVAQRQANFAPSELPPLAGHGSMRNLFSTQVYPVSVIGHELCDASNLMGTQTLDIRSAAVHAHEVNIRVTCYLGTTKVDLTNPALAGKRVRLCIEGGLGEVKVLLPAGVAIERRNMELLGSNFSQGRQGRGIAAWFKGNQPPPTEVPFTLEVFGRFILGEIKLKQLS